MSILEFLGKEPSRANEVRKQADKLHRFLNKNYSVREQSIIIKLAIRKQINDTKESIELDSRSLNKNKEDLIILENLKI